MYFIYCYENKVSKRCYVGQTNNIARRKREHLSNAYNVNSKDYNLLFHRKIRQYGIDSFNFSILEEIDSEDIETINLREEFWIKEKASFVRENGYNLTYGGGGHFIPRKISIADALRVIEMLKAGSLYSDISEVFGISSTYISMINHGHYFKQENEVYPVRKFGREDSDYALLTDLLANSDLSFSEIASETSISTATIKKFNAGTLRREEGRTYPIRAKKSSELRADKIKEMLLNSVSNDEIKRCVKTSDETIRRINLGITHRDNNLEYPLR